MGNEFITIIRPSFMRFCQDACRSAAFNHLLFRIAGKSKDQPKEKIQAGDILWYAKTEQITEEMSNAWGVCKVRKEVNGLIKRGLIGRRVNPTWGADRTKHFCFGTEQCEKLIQLCQEHAICIVHLGLPPEVMHLIYSSNATDTSIKCICAIHQMQLIDVSVAFDEYIEAIPIDSPTIDDYQDDNKEEEVTGSDEPDAPTSFSDEERNNLLRFGHQVAGERVETGIRITDKHKAMKPNETPYHIAGSAIGNERVDTPGRCTLPSKPVASKQAVAAGQAPIVTSLPIDDDPSQQSTVSHTPGPGISMPSAAAALIDGRHGAATGVQATPSLLPSEPARADFPPAGSTASGATTAQASGDHVTGASNPTIHKPHTVPKRPATSAPILSPEEQTVIDRWFIAMNKRYPLTDSLIKAAKLLAPCNPSVEDLKTVRGFCFTSNPEWFRDKRKGAVTLLDIAKNWEGWQSSQEKPEEPAQLPKIDEPERGVSGLPKFKTTRKYNYDD